MSVRFIDTTVVLSAINLLLEFVLVMAIVIMFQAFGVLLSLDGPLRERLTTGLRWKS